MSLLRPKNSLVSGFPTDPSKFMQKNYFSASERKNTFLPTDSCAPRAKNYKSPTNRKSTEMPKGREMNVFVCFVSFI